MTGKQCLSTVCVAKPKSILQFRMKFYKHFIRMNALSILCSVYSIEVNSNNLAPECAVAEPSFQRYDITQSNVLSNEALVYCLPYVPCA